MRYPFLAEYLELLAIRAMCCCLHIQPSRLYAWLQTPLITRAQEDKRQN